MVNIRNKFLETHCNVRLKQERLVTGKEQAGLSVEVSKALCEISMTSNCLESDQVISGANATAKVERAPGPGLQQVIEETVPHNDIEEASSTKLQASSAKLIKK